jgi:hypothetical protein
MTAALCLCQFFGAVSSRLLRGIGTEAVYNPDCARSIMDGWQNENARHRGIKGALCSVPLAITSRRTQLLPIRLWATFHTYFYPCKDTGVGQCR